MNGYEEEDPRDPQWYLDGGPSMDSNTDRQFTIGFHVTKEEFELILMARLLDGKSLASLVKAGLKRELEDLLEQPDYKAAFAVKKQRAAFRFLDHRGAPSQDPR